ncbi:MAG TPA: TIGR02530 family flagellar biosynthesis protein [Solirubrobacteraceae bacterium]|jgi:flagellar operon protein
MSAIANPALIPPGAGAIQPSTPATQQARSGEAAPATPFSQVLADVSSPAGAQGTGRGGDLHFSKHALQRVQRRGITLDPSTLGRLQEGVGRAASKGSRDSVVLVDGTAFVVSVANKTVLTAVPSEHMHEQVFTNIDSAVIA